jgi:tRNA uridine 5-carbamoylmethylation protein Kti12
MQGLPASGKTTKAKELIETYGNYVRVNRDLLRKMLHFGKWSGKNEALTILAEKSLVRAFLTNKINVIVDDTNLGKSVDMWKELAKEMGVKHEVIKMDTPIEECIERDKNRKETVGFDVIINMARKNGLYNFERPEIICDVDGTLSDLTHRLHFVKTLPKDWKSFFGSLSDDAPRQEVIDEVNALSETHDIIIVSGRPDNYKKETIDWLNRYGVKFKTIIMRKSGDKRPDDEIKEEILNGYFNKSKIALVIDDRPRVIRMWTKNQLKVRDVGGGIEF